MAFVEKKLMITDIVVRLMNYIGLVYLAALLFLLGKKALAWLKKRRGNNHGRNTEEEE